MTDDELRAMIDEFDRDGDGEINEEEFIAIMTGDTQKYTHKLKNRRIKFLKSGVWFL